MIEIILKQLGFTSKEIQLYLIILKHNKLSYTELAQISKINRTTVYSAVKVLIKKGIVFEDLSDATKKIAAFHPSELEKLVQKEEKELQNKKAKINTLVSELQKLTADKNYTIPKIIFIPEEQIEDHLFKRHDTWVKSVNQYDSTFWGFQDKSFTAQFSPWINFSYANLPEQTYVKLLSNDSQVETNLEFLEYKRRIVKYFAGDDFTGTILVCGDYLVMIVTDTSPHHLIEITDAKMAANFRTLFSGIWNK